jgi:hypothetical protein
MAGGEGDFLQQIKAVYLKQQAIELADGKSLWIDMEMEEEWAIDDRAEILAGIIDPSYRPAKRRRDDTKWDIIEKCAGKEVQCLSPIHLDDEDHAMTDDDQPPLA